MDGVLPYREALDLRNALPIYVDTAVAEDDSKTPEGQRVGASTQAGSSGSGGTSAGGNNATAGSCRIVSFNYTSSVTGSRLVGNIVWTRLGAGVIQAILLLSESLNALSLLEAEQQLFAVAEVARRVCGYPSTGLTPEMLTTSATRLSAIGSETCKVCSSVLGIPPAELIEKS
jgi:hypothetical protein